MMNILLLGPSRKTLETFFSVNGDNLIRTEVPISVDDDILKNIDFVISYGYKHIIKQPVIEKFADRMINLHISFLPWNRGADPNLWSFLENTSKGVSIHRVAEKIDAGEILLQKKMDWFVDDTLATTYYRLSSDIEKLLIDNWSSIIENKIAPILFQERGSFHNSRDKQKYLHLLTKGWDTPVTKLVGKTKVNGGGVFFKVYFPAKRGRVV